MDELRKILAGCIEKGDFSSKNVLKQARGAFFGDQLHKYRQIKKSIWNIRRNL